MDQSSTFVSSNYAYTPSMPMREQQAEIILARFMPPSLSQSDIPNHLSTYTPGEDFGRLAKLAKEFGLARIRNQKKQIRKGAPKLAITDNQQINTSSRDRQPALRYVFSGYSIWLELEQQETDKNGIGDLEFAVKEAADEFCLGGAIPAPHVTALYGITTIATDQEATDIFRKDVVTAITNRAEKQQHESAVKKLWPDLVATGILVGAEFDGVNGGEMDMAWAEVSFATSSEHESLISELYDIFYRRDATRLDAVNTSMAEHESLISELYDIFYRRDATRLDAVNTSMVDEKKEELPPRSQPWVPHLSICYDNPEGFGSVLTRQLFEDFLRNKCPALAAAAESSDTTAKFARAVSGISLWKTAGTMADWKCLDRFQFDCVKP
eukprot:CAMPEP_0201710940 /NCGR_PEP_ID=MMETSP0578-20130828/58888_1 /ASSEMBLY_ACC=CAM_ASM_000663 /TAXON_ID=267565 /ORGANISM="Skeletonema grethea, Strain CCMP 1804" /LENGTH=381 /DNA_ID=CAMNT_0048199983 /DNA_START=91 /DNA_END=1236 /DNA_ORIENTATION=+